VINWDDNIKRKEFREALQRCYPNESDLKIFVDEELNENLAVITSGNLGAAAYGLIAWARAKGRLDEVFEAFQTQNPNDPVASMLQARSLIQQTAKLSEQDWELLFEQFFLTDFADLQRAFFQGFQQVFERTFQQVRPDYPPLYQLDHIRELLTQYDQPELSVRFVERAIAEFRRSDMTRDVTGLEQWCDRIIQQHGVSRLAPRSSLEKTQRGYLLMAVEESGADVIVYPELQVTGEETAIEFGVSPVRCSFAEIPDYLPIWIKRAEEALSSRYESQEIFLELFLPCSLLEEDLAMTWEVRDKRDRLIYLGLHQPFMVRSFERILDKRTRKTLEQNWKLLKECMGQGNACDNFLLQKSILEKRGALQVLLKNKLGLKLLAPLPQEQVDRQDLLYDIIDAAVPIAFWSPSVGEISLAELETQIHGLSKESNLTDFTDLASRWQVKLAMSETESVRHIRLLCDCPDRFPNLPDPDQEADLLVAF
jgi:vWA-MoxR associated protein C-terminal domain/Effector-associated domain 1